LTVRDGQVRLRILEAAVSEVEVKVES
jgi:hypothetical protein